MLMEFPTFCPHTCPMYFVLDVTRWGYLTKRSTKHLNWARCPSPSTPRNLSNISIDGLALLGAQLFWAPKSFSKKPSLPYGFGHALF